MDEVSSINSTATYTHRMMRNQKICVVILIAAALSALAYNLNFGFI